MTNDCNCPNNQDVIATESPADEKLLVSIKEELSVEDISEKFYLGVDVGSISTNLAIIDGHKRLIKSVYIRTEGRPIQSIQKGVTLLKEMVGEDFQISGVGATGSARQLTGLVVGADIVRNEITAHSLASLNENSEIQTIMEIGGQDSKIILIRNGVPIDFAMNTVCAAGTGSFLDQQANRLEIAIEDFGQLAINSDNAVAIAGRCTVFAESDMIHKQQLGHPVEDIIRGLSEALVRNYLNNVGKGKDIRGPIMFQGGVAANVGIRDAFRRSLIKSGKISHEDELIVPENYGVMGAIGAAILAMNKMVKNPNAKTKFVGWQIPNIQYKTKGFECKGCPNICEIIEVYMEEEVIARWGSKCGKWDV
ncbi:MAG: acyl-CoA dehydratase activase [Candidatus Heimdallarchaeota archaeon]